MKTIATTFILFYIVNHSLCQDYNFENFEGLRIKTTIAARFEQSYYYTYDSLFIISNKNVKYEAGTVEETLQKLFSPGQSYLNLFENKDKILEFNNILLKGSLDSISNYYKPISKLELIFKGRPTAIIKFFTISGKKRSKPYSVILQKTSIDYKIASDKELDQLEYIFTNLKSQNFYALRSSIKIPKNEALKNIYDQTRDNGNILNITKLYFLLKSMEESNIDKIKELYDL